MRHVRPPAMTRTRRTARRHWTNFAAYYALPPVSISAVSISTVSISTGPSGTAANISIQTRYCTATVADKPFGEMPNLIRLPG
jgi:hypothetical protein